MPSADSVLAPVAASAASGFAGSAGAVVVGDSGGDAPVESKARHSDTAVRPLRTFVRQRFVGVEFHFRDGDISRDI